MPTRTNHPMFEGPNCTCASPTGGAQAVLSLRKTGLYALLALLFVFTVPAHAHKVNLFANVEGDRISVEGYFNDGKRAQNSNVTVFGPDGAKLVEGKTDDNGMFSFVIPQRTDLRISLYAGMGHRAEYTVQASELGAGDAAAGGDSAANGIARPEATTEAAEEAAAGEGSAATSGGMAGTGAAPAVPAAEIQAMVRQAVGEALNPVMRNLSELKEQRTFSDIVGGIGFIVGIIGVFFYLKARRTTDKAAPTGAAR